MFKKIKKETQFSEVKNPGEVEDPSITVPRPKEDIDTTDTFINKEDEEEETNKQASIVSARIIDGMIIETIIHSNYSLGEVGSTFEQ